MPTDIEKFYAFILQRHFRYWQEPKTVLLEYYTKSTSDLKDVDDRIINISKDIERYRKDKNPAERQKHLPVLRFYLQQTEYAREEILRFLKIEKEEFVLQKCTMPKGFSEFSIPYTYYMYPNVCDVVYPTMISNKFNFIDSNKSEEIRNMYNNRPDDFKDYLQGHILEGQLIDRVRIECDENYFFNKQKSFINEALDTYERGGNIVFSSACFLIVEGLLHDLCLQLGIPEVDILASGFQPKLDKIYEVLRTDINYPYYSFTFRLLRNQVVHGTANSEGLKEIADLLFLDLVDMIKVTKSKKILMNSKVLCLKRALQEQGEEKKYAFLTGYLALDDVTLPPSFYNITEANEKIIDLLKVEGFWSYIDNLLNSEFSDYKLTGAHLLRKVKNLRIDELDEKCRERFKTHHNIKGEFDRKAYLNMIFQYSYWM